MSSVSQTKFSPLLLLGLVAPLIVAIVAWFVQFFARFPPRSLCASLTAATFLAVPMIEILAVPVAVTTPHPPSRTADGNECILDHPLLFGSIGRGVSGYPHLQIMSIQVVVAEPNKPLVPTRRSEALLLAAQPERWAGI